MYDGLCVACQSGHIPPAYQSPKTPVTPCLAHQQQQSTGTAHGRAGWNEAYSEFLPESWNSTASASVYMAVTSQPAGRLTSMHAGIPNLGYLLSSCLVTARYPGGQPSRDRPGCPRFDLPLTILQNSALPYEASRWRRRWMCSPLSTSWLVRMDSIPAVQCLQGCVLDHEK